MAAAQPGQHGVIKTLAAEADPVDAQGQIGRQTLLIKAGRIQLQGDFGPGRQPEALAEAVQQPPQLLRREQ